VTVSTSQAIPDPAQAASPATGPSSRLLKHAGLCKIRRHDFCQTALKSNGEGRHSNRGDQPLALTGVDRRQVTPIGSRRSERGPGENPVPLLTWTFWSGRPDLNRRPLDPQSRIRRLARSD
jgi:hypothetical protein